MPILLSLYIHLLYMMKFEDSRNQKFELAQILIYHATSFSHKQ